MYIDLIFLIILLVALIKGLRQGIIVALFSMLALIVGLAAAIKLSAVVAMHLKENLQVSERWLPILAFLLVFIIVIFAVRWIAGLIKMAADAAWLGWADKLGGAVLYIFIYITIYSVFLFYATNLHVLQNELVANSKTYPFIEPWGPKVIDFMGSAIPVFKNMFKELQDFFAQIAAK